jgi:polysaccharide biosynthesis protein PslG
MNRIPRRTVLQLPAAAAALAQTPGIGKLKTRTSKSIFSSPLSIGFETLDRKMFDPERTYPHLANLGVKWARCQTGWARTETSKAQYDFAWLDSVVDNLLRIGIQPWFNLGYGNRLYTPGPPHESAVGWVPLNSKEATDAWLRYVGKLAEHFGKRVHHWEIWNEPNITNFWQPDKPDAARYTELVKITAPVIRKRIPKVTIIGGAFAGFPVLDYAQACFAAGLGAFIDKVSYHPYRPQPEVNYAAEMRAFRSMIARYKPGLALWQGENGAPSTNNSAGALRDLPWNETRQAKWLLRRILTDLSLDVEVTSYFHTVDMVNYVWTTGQSNTTNAKGVLRGTDYTTKPAYYAYQNVCALFDSETRRADFLARVDGGAAPVESSSFQRKGSAIYIYWAPADLMTDPAPGKARLSLWSGAGARFENPVLVDLLSGEISQPGKVSRSGGTTVVDGCPLRDYPMLITDGSVVG